MVVVHMTNAELILLVGLPGSGKSTYANEDRGHVVICPDDFRRILTGQDYYKPAEESVWSHVKTSARALLLRGYKVVIDATALTRSARSQWIQIAKEMNVPASAIYFDTPYDICLQRNKSRERNVPEIVMASMRSSLTLPTTEEGFASIITKGP